MSLKDFTDEKLEERIDTVFALIEKEKDHRNLPSLNKALERLLDEQVERMEKRGEL